MRAILFTILILALTATAAFAGGKEEDAVAELTKLGAKFEYSADKRVVKGRSEQFGGHGRRSALTWYRSKNWNALDLRITKVGDGGTQYLGFLKNLKFLNMFRTDLSDAGLARLKNLDKLETLLIGAHEGDGCGIGDGKQVFKPQKDESVRDGGNRRRA